MKKNLWIFLSLAFILGSCSSIKVTADHDASVDFTKYKTYSYLGWSENSTKMLNDFDKRRIEAAFASEFIKRGMKYVQTDGDVEVSLYLVTDQKTATTAYTDYYRPYSGYYYGYGWGWGGGYASTTYHQYDYTVGTLVCDVFDGNEKKLVWQSVGSGTINDNPSTRDKTIIHAVERIMSLYPIKPEK
jgi:hypothetical protein